MGNAAPAFTQHTPGLNQAYVQIEKDLDTLFTKTEEMDKLFKKIARSGATKAKAGPEDEVHTHSSTITLKNLSSFLLSSEETFLKVLNKNPVILQQAHNFACKRNHMDEGENLLPRNRFKLLLCCLFYFSLLWDLFTGESMKLATENETLEKIEDTNKVDIIIDKVASLDLAEVSEIAQSSRMIMKEEYMRIQHLVASIAGSDVDMDTTVKNLERDFEAIDKDHKGSISFGEFCTYATNHISIANDEFAEYCKEYARVNSEVTSEYKEEVLPALDFTSKETMISSLEKQQSVQNLNATYKNAKKIQQMTM